MTAELATSTVRLARSANRAAVRFHSPARGQSNRSQRAQLLAAFGEIGAAVDAKTARARTEDWYRSSGADWTRGLD
jgi:hypothetical protein